MFDERSLSRGIRALAAALPLLVAGCSDGVVPGYMAIPPVDPALPPAAALILEAPVELSSGPVPDAGAFKARLVRVRRPVGDGFAGRLVAVFGLGVGPSVADFDGTTHAARDLFVTRSDDDGLTWSPPEDLSGTADLWSRTVDHDGDPGTPAAPYHGDVGRAALCAVDERVLVAWTSRYVPSGAQGAVVYPEAGGIEVPYACVYATVSSDAGETWSAPQRLGDGVRDAASLMAHGSSAGFALVWQEDPRGLQPGEGEGPGDGGSGAHVTQGTDIWFSSIRAAQVNAGGTLSAPARLTDNFLEIGTDGLESGDAGASRPNVRLVGGTAVLVYEETKGRDAAAFGDTGKYVRYHLLPSFTDPSTDPTRKVGWILSDPEENGRRARVLAQGTPGPETGMRLVVLWRQGTQDQGGPADIVMRVGHVREGVPSSNGLWPEDMLPAVASHCTTRSGAAASAPGINLSSAQGPGAETGDDPDEDARAHRGILRGDTLIMAYAYTPSWWFATFTDQATYDLVLRRSFDGGATWEGTRNLSSLADGNLVVMEPRLVATPSSSDPEEPQDPAVLYVTWVVADKNLLDPTLGITPRDILLTRSTDLASTFEPPVVLAGGPECQAEPQLVLAPHGLSGYAVWMEEAADGAVEVVFRCAWAPPP